MKNDIIEHGSEPKYTFKERACESIGFFFFKIVVKINNATNYCLERSSAKEKIKKAVDDLDQKEEIGEKVVAFDEGIADAITEPIETYVRAQEAEEKVYDCHEAVQALFYAWETKDDILMEKLFNQFGLFKTIEEEE